MLNTATGSDTDGWTATNKTALTAGVYLFLDGNASTDTLTQAVPMIVSTGSVNAGVLSLGDSTAEVDMKSTVSGTQTKSTTSKSASVGETVRLNWATRFRIRSRPASPCSSKMCQARA